jgi:hypothetical protein
MSDEIPFGQSATAGCLSGAGSVLAALPLSFLYLLWPKQHGEDYTILILWANAPLLSLLWGVPIWAWLRRERPHFANGWICAHGVAALLNGACWGFFLIK